MKNMTATNTSNSPSQAQVIDTSHNGVVIAVTSALGGSGKSTVSSLLAAQLAKSSEKAFEEGLMGRSLKVCVVDLDIFDSQLHYLIGEVKPTVLNIALANEPLSDRLIFDNLVYSSRMGFHALLAPIKYITDTAEINPEFYLKVIKSLRTMFDVIILDTSSQHYDAIVKDVALPESDAILLVTTLTLGSLNSTNRWFDVARTPVEHQGHGINLKKVGIVINQSVKNVYIDDDNFQRYIPNVPKISAIPLDTVAVQAAGNSGNLEKLVESHGPIGNAYFALAEKLVSKFNLGLEVKLSPIVNK
jgi:MinD-like ATPase involved in chromosome partitioning or flagellar assembly